MKLFLFLSAAAALHPERAAMIADLNSRQSMTWRAGTNRFADQPIGITKSLCGVKENNRDLLYKAVAEGKMTRYEAKKGMDLPDSFDSEKNWPQCAQVIGDIRDQSNCGCCWAFGAASAASDRLCIASKGKVALALSAENTCFCAETSGCNGGTLDVGWSFIGAGATSPGAGVVSGGQFNDTGPFTNLCSAFSLPHCHHHGPQGNDPYPDEGSVGCPAVKQSPACPVKCDPGAAAPHANFTTDKYSFTGGTYFYSGEQNIMSAILLGGPVETAFTVYEDFENYVSGIYQHTTGNSLGGHAVRFVGWGVENNVKYWKVANSWNPYWGENGYFRIVRGVDHCYIEDQVVATGPTATWMTPQGEF